MNDTIGEFYFISTTNVDRWKHTDNIAKSWSTGGNSLMTEGTVDSKSTKCASKMNGSAHDKTDTASLSPSPSVVTANTVLSVLAIFFGAVGNIFVYYRLEKRNVPHFLFASLLLNGIFSTLLKLPLRMVVFIFSKFFNVHHILSPINLGCGVVNAWTLLLMAIDRHDCVLRPFNRRLSLQNVKFVIVLSWASALVLGLIVFFVSLFSESKGNRQIIFQLTGGGLMLFTGTSFILIIITAIRTIKSLRSSPLPEMASLYRKQEVQMSWLAYKICFVTLLCWLPAFVCVSALAEFGNNQTGTSISALILTTTLTEFHYVINPAIFYRYLIGRNNSGVLTN
ncbi:uncharacterized protein LOC114956011 [Acropora millepora]|uniref:uncharacterized protein LOC114956011 n=1 Tax=Acropora millepora TaxID=45264 RepID=UPI001CF2EB26|nr:uncharacterized protein LOC114956011 [Acropora millepora]